MWLTFKKNVKHNHDQNYLNNDIPKYKYFKLKFKKHKINEPNCTKHHVNM